MKVKATITLDVELPDDIFHKDGPKALFEYNLIRLESQVAEAAEQWLPSNFPRYQQEHIHLTGQILSGRLRNDRRTEDAVAGYYRHTQRDL